MPTTAPRRHLFEPEEGVGGSGTSAEGPRVAAYPLEDDGTGSTAYLGAGQRLFDLGLLLLVALPALAVALPIALLNLVVFRDPRRVLFLQERVGRDGTSFRILKFRTMADAKDAFLSWGAGEDRLRVTRFGRLLRNTHLDELPQLVNVLRGEMSIVGPRPEMVEVDAWALEHVPGFRDRNVARPGITGLAQVTQGYASKCAESYSRKLSLDRMYCRRASLGLDLRILLRTFVWMARGKGWSYHVVHATEELRAARESESLSRAA